MADKTEQIDADVTDVTTTELDSEESSSSTEDKSFSDYLKEVAGDTAEEAPEAEDGDEANEEEEEEPIEDDVADTDKSDLQFLKDNRERVIQLLELERKLSDKDGYEEVLKALVNGITKMHGGKPEDFLGRSDSEDSDTEEGDFETSYEQEIYRKAKAAAIKELKSELSPLQKEIASLKEAEQKRAVESEQRTKVEQGFRKWTTQVEKETGFKPSRSQVEQALRDHPSLEPVKAIKLAYMSDILKMTSKQASRQAPKAPTLINRSSESGRAVSGEKRFSDFLKEVAEQ